MHRRYLVKVTSSRVMQSFGPFRLRAQVAHYSDGMEVELPQYAITLLGLDPIGGEGTEEEITLLQGKIVDVARVVQRLQDWLRESEELSRRLTQAREDVLSSPDSDALGAYPWLAHLPEGLDRAQRERERVVRALGVLEAERQDAPDLGGNRSQTSEESGDNIT